jgi:hypothetical protein
VAALAGRARAYLLTAGSADASRHGYKLVRHHGMHWHALASTRGVTVIRMSESSSEGPSLARNRDPW